MRSLSATSTTTAARFLLYVFLASAGGALGSTVIYAIGYAGGEMLLRKRLSPEKFEKIHASFEKHEFWALMFPAMLPPPTPFKIVVLAAAGFEMNFGHFLLAIFAGRFIRFLIEALLTLWFGPGIVSITGNLFAHHYVSLLVGAAVVVAWLVWRNKLATKKEAQRERSIPHCAGKNTNRPARLPPGRELWRNGRAARATAGTPNMRAVNTRSPATPRRKTAVRRHS